MSRFENLEFGGQEQLKSEKTTAQKDEHYYQNEAEHAFRQGQFEQALRAYSKMLEFNPHDPAPWTGQVRMLIELGEFKEAKVWADKALEKFPHEPELLAAKAVSLGRLGDVAAALVYSDASIEENGDSPYVWLARGDVLLARKEARAEFCFEKALNFSPVDWVVPWLISRIYYFYAQFARALKLAQQALGLNGAEGVLWLQIGKCQAALGLLTEAKHSLEQAGQLQLACPELQKTRALLSETRGLKRWRGLWHKWFGV